MDDDAAWLAVEPQEFSPSVHEATFPTRRVEADALASFLTTLTNPTVAEHFATQLIAHFGTVEAVVKAPESALRSAVPELPSSSLAALAAIGRVGRRLSRARAN